jgi:uncharacterized protein
MTPREMDRLIDEHFQMEARADLDGILATFTDDVEHDVVGNPDGPLHGPAAIRPFYEALTSDLEATGVTPLRRYHGDSFAVDDVVWEGRAVGRPFGIEGRNRPVRFRLLHVFEFRDGRIARENVWMDFATFYAQLGVLPTPVPA